jgi:hypothetical protein
MLFDLDQGEIIKINNPLNLLSIRKSCVEYNSTRHCAVESWRAVKV